MPWCKEYPLLLTLLISANPHISIFQKRSVLTHVALRPSSLVARYAIGDWLARPLCCDWSNTFCVFVNSHLQEVVNIAEVKGLDSAVYLRARVWYRIKLGRTIGAIETSSQPRAGKDVSQRYIVFLWLSYNAHVNFKLSFVYNQVTTVCSLTERNLYFITKSYYLLHY